ncbi:MAG: bL28 family ribosomal protein [Patescibacteria group bacterium]
MSRTCQVCRRGTTSSQSRSHSNIATKRTQKINIQTKNIDGQKIKVCAKCISTAIKQGKDIKDLM